MDALDYDGAYNSLLKIKWLAENKKPHYHLMLSQLLFIRGMHDEALKQLDKSNDLLNHNEKLMKEDLEYLQAYSRFLRNNILSESESAEELDAVDYRNIELDKVSRKFLINFPLKNHPNWKAS